MDHLTDPCIIIPYLPLRAHNVYFPVLYRSHHRFPFDDAVIRREYVFVLLVAADCEVGTEKPE